MRKLIVHYLALILTLICVSAEASIPLPFAFLGGMSAPVTVAGDIIIAPMVNGLVPSDGTLTAQVVQAGQGAQTVVAGPAGGASTITTMFVNNFLAYPSYPHPFVVDGTNFTFTTGGKVFARSFTINDETAIGYTYTAHNKIATMFYGYKGTPIGGDASIDYFTHYTTDGSYMVLNCSVDQAQQRQTFDAHFQYPGEPGGGSQKDPMFNGSSNAWYLFIAYGNTPDGGGQIVAFDTNGYFLGINRGIITTNASQWDQCLIGNYIAYIGVTSLSNYNGPVVHGFDTKANPMFGILAADVGTPFVTPVQTAFNALTVNCNAAYATNFDLSVSHNGASFSTLQSSTTNTVTVQTGLVDGDTYAYKTTAYNQLLGVTKGPVTSTTVTINNGPFPDQAQWKLNNGSGSDNIGGNTYGLVNLTQVTGQDGIANHAFSFNGTSSYAFTFSPAYATYPFSVSLWYKGTATSCVLWMNSATGNPQWDAFYIELDSTGHPKASRAHLNDFHATSTSAVVCNDNVWHNLVAEYISTSSCTMSVDGTQTGTDATTVAPTGMSGVTLGAATVNSSQGSFTAGAMDDNRVWSIALSTAEKAAIFSQGAQ